MESTRVLLSLADVARLARVERPVASMWRSRARNTDLPFPAPVTRRGTQDLFDADAVSAWLEATGRGNNPEAARDAAAHVAAQTVDAEELSAVLALRAIGDEPLSALDPEDILDRADEVDPDDEFLYRELDAAEPRLDALAALADRMSDAAYSPAAAFEKVLADRHRRGQDPEFRTALAPALVSLVVETAVALANATGAEHFRDSTPGGSDLLVGVVNRLGEAGAAGLSLDGPVSGDAHRHPATRRARRRLNVLAATHDTVTLHSTAEPGPRIVLAQLPGPADPDVGPVTILRAIDEIALGLDPRDAALVVAPARILVGALAGTAGPLRSQTLRTGRVRAVVGLPAGLARGRSRQAMACWVIGADQSDQAIAERSALVADLGTTVLDESARQDLLSDLAASLGGPRAVWAHAFRFGRLVRMSSLLAEGGALTAQARRALPASRRPAAGAAAAAPLLRAEQLAEDIARHGLPLGDPAAGPTALPALHPGGQPPAEWTTVGALLAEGALRYVAGTRLADEEIAADGGWHVLDASSLDRERRGSDRSPASAGRVDQLAFAGAHPRAALTAPGDVVFRTGPTPSAAVDRLGSAVVRAPARVLRLSPGSGLVPEVLAEDLSAGPDGPWRRWPVRRFTPETAAGLHAARNALAEARAATARQLERLDHLTDLVTAGTAAGALQTTTEGTA